MELLGTSKRALRNAAEYLGDAAHRRFVATLVALVGTHLLGKALDADQLALYLEIIVGGLGGAWSSNTPRLDDKDGS